MSLAINNLKACFLGAKESNAMFVGILIHMDGFPKDEVIINERENFDSKLAYYEKTYDDNLEHKYSKGVKIVGFTHSNNYEGIREDLLGGLD